MFIRQVSCRRRIVVGLLTALTAASAVPVVAQNPQLPPGLAPQSSATSQPLTQSTQAGGTLSAAEAEALAQQRLNAPGPQPTATAGAPVEAPKKSIDLWQLAQDGGPLMYPIYACSIVVVCFAFERALGLRRRKLMPPQLVAELGDLSRRPGGLDPRAVYRACLRYPSTAATVLRAVLLKIGRPYAELEQTLKEVNEREAAKLYTNVRPLELQISIAPLLGLLGTVQGMIMAFFVTANADKHVNKADQLAEGIYVALVTTFAGLCVAIPAAVLAHYFEGRIQKLFRDLDELILSLLPNFERFEGKLRVNRQTLGGEAEEESDRPTTPVKVPH